jgi:predicted cupin superfamily sugar epimerase
MPKPPIRRVVLGPDLANGNVLQLPVRGGTWKAGRLLAKSSSEFDYCLIGEAVGPAFDVNDFSFISHDEVAAERPDLVEALTPFLQASVDGKETEAFDTYYNDDEKREQRTSQRK